MRLVQSYQIISMSFRGYLIIMNKWLIHTYKQEEKLF